MAGSCTKAAQSLRKIRALEAASGAEGPGGNRLPPSQPPRALSATHRPWRKGEARRNPCGPLKLLVSGANPANNFFLRRRDACCFWGSVELTAGWTRDLQRDSQGSQSSHRS